MRFSANAVLESVAHLGARGSEMTARLKGRATVMPDRLFVPDPVASIHLQIANFRVAEIGAGLCASDAQSITRAVLAEQ